LILSRRKEILLQRIDTDSEAHPWVKRPGREADHSPQSRAEKKISGTLHPFA